ncbi:MAG: hypothetical protein Q7S45_04865 [Candidatus Curtissbacteria bacterium]|nr:hypothetical protein [Candidatus Curtissbacteria bacterium]
MNKTDLEQIGALIEEKLEPIKETLDEHTNKLDGIVAQLSEVSEDVTEIKETLESHTRRITTIEDHLGLTVSTE